MNLSNCLLVHVVQYDLLTYKLIQAVLKLWNTTCRDRVFVALWHSQDRLAALLLWLPGLRLGKTTIAMKPTVDQEGQERVL